ncbi:MAG: glycosyltransferase [Chloracidobacterium sp.]|uniref:Glycosyltransferase n=1 Tax=Chloracidobacterium validum TaxID=2821543 RepID=A0ABX8BF84_9BACT|nr:glycosyltransferase [Chloracidobacterium validum]QUW04334.1 glycosyltransferase [Chloracidobacterium validum]
MTTRPVVLFVTSYVSPFMTELTAAVNDLGKVAFHAAYAETTQFANHGAHWNTATERPDTHRRAPEVSMTDFLRDCFQRYRPQVVICGYGRGPAYETTFALCRDGGAVFGVFAEQPMRDGRLKHLVRVAYYQQLWRRQPPAFVLAVGDRAVQFYRRLLRDPEAAVFFPYYQDLRPVLAIPDRPPRERLRFLFSGRLAAQHGIRGLAAAFERLAQTHPGRFDWCISGTGPEERWIRQALARSPALAQSVSFDREFATWQERLRPFAASDVLVLPSFHAGWGLVIPEALGAGMPVITTRGVEAARYYVEAGVNGLFVEPNPTDIHRALAFCLEHPQAVQAMRAHTRASVTRGDVQVGAARLLGLLARWL